MRSRSVAGAVVALTGGARGIGLATAKALTAEGARVAIGDLDGDLAQEAATSVGGQTIGLPLDVTDHAGFSAFLDEVEARLGPLDVLVNNAGIMPINRVTDEPGDVARAQVEVNLLAVIHGTKDAVRRFKARGNAGHVVNLSSAAGRIPIAGAATYTATKHAVSGFSNALHIELVADRWPIHVTAVHTAIVRTELSEGFEDNKGVSPVAPEDVAAAIVDALQRPRPDVYVPRRLGPAVRTGALVPRRVGEWLNRVLGGERAALDAIGRPERDAYEGRVRKASKASEELSA